MAKKKTVKSGTMTMFDFIEALTCNKIDYKKIKPEDWKQFDVYMINRFLSMSPELIDIINHTQRYTSAMTKEQSYRLLFGILPQNKFYSKYIKSQIKQKYTTELIEFIASKFSISKDNSLLYIDIYMNNIDELYSLLKLHGYMDSEIKKICKVKK